jgi:hypothetical protein
MRKTLKERDTGSKQCTVVQPWQKVKPVLQAANTQAALCRSGCLKRRCEALGAVPATCAATWGASSQGLASHAPQPAALLPQQQL